MAKPRVNVNSYANKFAMPNEQIVEFYDTVAANGGLISFRWDAERQVLTVSLYRLDPNVEVVVPEENLKHE